jgi:hypothetical protein
MRSLGQRVATTTRAVSPTATNQELRPVQGGTQQEQGRPACGDDVAGEARAGSGTSPRRTTPNQHDLVRELAAAPQWSRSRRTQRTAGSLVPGLEALDRWWRHATTTTTTTPLPRCFRRDGVRPRQPAGPGDRAPRHSSAEPVDLMAGHITTLADRLRLRHRR